MSIHNRLKALERAAASAPAGGPRVLTEAEFDELSDDELCQYLRNVIDLRVLDEDDGPTFEEACAAAGVAPTKARPGESAYEASRRVTDAELRVYKEHMDGCMARSAERRAARKAARLSDSALSVQEKGSRP